jgi:hypothetical protein
MSITVAELNARLVADTSQFTREMKSASNDTDGFGSKMSGAMGVVGKFAVVAGAAGVTAATAFGVKAVMAASDLAEQMSKLNVVFGTSGKVVTDWADQMAKDFGLPKTQILEAASSLGLIGKASGLAQPAAAKLSTQLAGLAADAASFYNVPLEEALAAIQSGLVGEAEPMRRFGVLLNEGAVKAEAYRLGIAKTGDELTEQQKVQARSSLIMKGMTDASGDLVRTQDSLANRLREVQGRAENFAATLGTALLPYVLKAMDLMEKWAPVIKDKLVAAFDALKRAIEPVGGFFVKVFETARTAVEVFQTAWSILNKGADAQTSQGGIIGWTVAFANAIFDLVQWVKQVWPQIEEAIAHAMNAIEVSVKTTLAVIQTVWHAVGDDILSAVKTVWNFIQETVENAMQFIRGIIQTVLAIINGDWGKAWDGIKDIVGAVWDQIGNIVSTGIGLIRSLLGGAVSVLMQLGRDLMDGLWSGIQAVWDTVIGWLTGLGAWVGQVLGAVLNPSTLVGIGMSVIQGLWNGITAVWGAVIGWLGGLGAWIGQVLGRHPGTLVRHPGRLEPSRRLGRESRRVDRTGRGWRAQPEHSLRHRGERPPRAVERDARYLEPTLELDRQPRPLGRFARRPSSEWQHPAWHRPCSYRWPVEWNEERCRWAAELGAGSCERHRQHAQECAQRFLAVEGDHQNR